MSPVAFPIVWAIALLAFAVILWRRVRILRAAPGAPSLDHLAERSRRALTVGLGQRRFLRGEQPAGVMHALIFWGFMILLLQVVTLFGDAFDRDWRPLGAWFEMVADVVSVLVIVAVLYMLWRRLIAHTPR